MNFSRVDQANSSFRQSQSNVVREMRNLRKDKRVETVKSLPSDIRLGIWGSSGAGKTTYMTMLFMVFRGLPDWTIQSANDEADEFIRRNNERMAEGHFPDRTQVDVDEKLKFYSYRLSLNSQDRHSITLNFIDAPGEYYQSMDTSLKVEDPSRPNQEVDIIDYLMDCDGIIFLLDPDPDGDNKNRIAYSTMLFNLFLEFNKRNRKNNRVGNQRLEQYIAFCVTKIDHDKIWENALKKDADEYVADLMAPRMTLAELSNDIWLELDKNKRQERSKHNRCQFFYISCLGRYQENGKSHPIYIPDKTSNAEPEPLPKTEISSGWGDNDYLFGISESEKTNLDSKVQSQDQGSYDPDGVTGSNVQPQPSKAPGGRINPDVRLQPSNICEPVLWLIDGISLHRPNRQQRY